MGPEVVDALQQSLRCHLRRMLGRIAGTLALVAIGTVAVGLAVSAGVIATADVIGTVPALLAWSGGLTLIVLLALGVRALRRRRIPPAATARAGTPAPAQTVGFQAGVEFGRSVSPLAAAAACFVIGTMVARASRR